METTSPDLTIRQVATLLQCTERTIQRWIAIGQLPAQRVGVRFVRIKKSDVDKLSQPIPAPEM
jgi:excisionase family DNA binding protein